MRGFVLVMGLVGLCAAAPLSVPGVPLKNAAAPGILMPAIGLGVGAYGHPPNATYPSPNTYNGEYWTNGSCATAVSQWLAAGGRRVDTSLKYYHDLAGVGWAINNSTVPREDIFVTSKVDDPYGFNTTLAHFDELLQVLNSSYVDLLLIHWPGPTYFLGHKAPNSSLFCHAHGPTCRQQTWMALEEIFHSGRARAIGVANFEQRHVQDILDLGSGHLVPAVNQLEFHPYWQETGYHEWLANMSITLNSYAPLGAPDFMGWHPEKWPVLIPNQPIVKEIAANVSRTPAQVLLQWNLQRGAVINPRTNKPAHMAENLALFGADAFKLSQPQMNAITNMPNVPPAGFNKVCPDPNLVP